MAKRLCLVSCLLLLVLFSFAQAPRRIYIPDIPGYKTLKCDFHIHTVFSDGEVWPTARVTEAIREGLDAIAVTDHIEHRPHTKSGDITADHNRAYAIARDYAAKQKDTLIVIHGSEVTRGMPPGHLNAIFLEDSNPLETSSWLDALRAAKAQGAFIFWNHPSWERQAPDGTPKWYDEHTALFDEGLIMGLEFFGAGKATTLEHTWIQDKNLAPLGNTDAHRALSYRFPAHRNMTLVFATEKSGEGIREALFARRTLAYSSDNRLCGEEGLLRALLESSLRVDGVVREGTKVTLNLANLSSLTFELRSAMPPGGGISCPDSLTVGPFESKTVELEMKKPSKNPIEIDFVIENFLAHPGQGMAYRYTAH